MSSVSLPGMSQITLQFVGGTRVTTAANDVAQAVGRIAGRSKAPAPPRPPSSSEAHATRSRKARDSTAAGAAGQGANGMGRTRQQKGALRVLVSAADMLRTARREGFAIGAFNVNNLEFLRAIVEAAQAERAPVILQVSEGAAAYMGFAESAAMCRAAAEAAKVPCALHLDHGSSLAAAVRCIRAGYSSVMIDSSKRPLDENIRVTRSVLEVAHAVDVSVEAEIGRIGGTEDDLTVSEREATLAVPAEVERFYAEAPVDALAVAIGSAHGHYRGVPKLDFERLRAIRDRVDVPLVLHGGSGIPDEAEQTAIGLGIAKVNVNTENQEAFAAELRKLLAEDPDVYDPRKILARPRDAAREMVRTKMRLFGASGKA